MGVCKDVLRREKANELGPCRHLIASSPDEKSYHRFEGCRYGHRRVDLETAEWMLNDPDSIKKIVERVHFNAKRDKEKNGGAHFDPWAGSASAGPASGAGM